jgi:hypothetical protein
MVDMVFLMMAIAFVITATLAAVATTISTSPTVRGLADKVVNGSFVFALISVVLAVWVLLRHY